MSIDNLRKWLGNAAPSPHDTELRRTVRDALIEHDALLDAARNQRDRLAFDALASLSEFIATPLAGYVAEPYMLSLDIKRLGKERDTARAELAAAHGHNEAALALLQHIGIDPHGSVTRGIEELAKRFASMRSERDADRAAWAEERKALEQQVAEAVTAEAQALQRADELEAVLSLAATVIRSEVSTLVALDSEGGGPLYETVSALERQRVDIEAALAPRAPEPEAKPDAVASLECSHCGAEAIVSPTGIFTEDEGDACMSCGMPGHVSVDDSINRAYWLVHEEDADRCNDPKCDECRELDAGDARLALEKSVADAKCCALCCVGRGGYGPEGAPHCYCVCHTLETEATEQRVGLTMHVCGDDDAKRPDCRACHATGLDDLEDVRPDAEVKP